MRQGDSMFFHIVRKEIADHIRKLRFLLISSTIILLFIIAGILYVAEYRLMTDNYLSPESRIGRLSRTGEMPLALFEQIPLMVQEKTNPLWFCSDGGRAVLPNVFRVDQNRNYDVQTTYYKTMDNPWIKMLDFIDWVFIIGFLVSFLVITLGYDAFSGEKEDGTLRLLLSNDIPRHTLLFGKFAGIFLTILIPMTIGQIVNLLIITFSGAVPLGHTDWLRIASVVPLTWLYLSVFIWITLGISSLTNNSAMSIVFLLVIWVTATIIIPDAGGLAARYVYSLPRKEMIDEKVTAVLDEAMSNERKKTREESAVMQRDGLIKAAGIRTEYQHMKFTQLAVARSFARLSPLSAFRYAAETMTATGIGNHTRLLLQLKRYRDEIGDFILSEERNISENPVGIIHYSVLSWNNFDIAKIPVFKEQPIRFAEGLFNAILDLGLLFVFNMVSFFAALFSFLRYDVR